MKRHPNHDALLAVFAAVCPWGDVRVFDQPLRRPCDFAVVVDGPEGGYTIAAATAEAWSDVQGMMATGFDFSASYERAFDRGWAALSLKYAPPGPARKAAEQHAEDRARVNAALDAAAVALCPPYGRSR